MIRVRGKHVHAHGAAIDTAIQYLNNNYPTEPVDLWFKDEPYIMTKEGPEYGVYYPEQPTIIVAIAGRTGNQIAGVIAYQYAIHMNEVRPQPAIKPWLLPGEVLERANISHFTPVKEKPEKVLK